MVRSIRFGIHADNDPKKTSDFRHGSDCTTGCANLHYGDLLPLWLKGEYVPALWKRDEVEKEVVVRVALEG